MIKKNFFPSIFDFFSINQNYDLNCCGIRFEKIDFILRMKNNKY